MKTISQNFYARFLTHCAALVLTLKQTGCATGYAGSAVSHGFGFKNQRGLPPIGLRLSPNKNQNPNRPLLARSSGYWLAGHHALEAVNDMAWRGGCMKNLPSIRALLLSLACNFITAGVQAQNQVQPAQARYNGHLLDHDSYEVRQSFIPGRGVGAKDPNIYVYNEEFAKRFRMPMQWASSELKGVDAAVFRVGSGYIQCGWGGDPKACSSKSYICEIDLFFDNQKYPLPWSAGARMAEIDRHKNSLRFFGRNGYLAARGLSPADDNDLFTHPQTGKALRWQKSAAERGSNGAAPMLSYDREMFKDMTMLTLNLSQCYGSPLREIWLAEGYVTYATDLKNNPNLLLHRTVLPAEFQARMKAVYTPFEDGTAAFFKQEGEKALKSLQSNPVPNTPIVPLP